MAKPGSYRAPWRTRAGSVVVHVLEEGDVPALTSGPAVEADVGEARGEPSENDDRRDQAAIVQRDRADRLLVLADPDPDAVADLEVVRRGRLRGRGFNRRAGRHDGSFRKLLS